MVFFFFTLGLVIMLFATIHSVLVTAVMCDMGWWESKDKYLSVCVSPEYIGCEVTI